MRDNFIDIYKENFSMYNNEIYVPMSNFVTQIINQIDESELSSIVVYPGGKELNMTLISYYSLHKRYKNYSYYDDNITDELEIEDKVYYDGRLGIFKGKKIYKLWGDFTKHFSEEIKNSYAVKVEFSKGSIEFVKENDFYKITKYNGDATRLNKIESKKSNKYVDDLIVAMNLKKDSVNTLVHSSTLYVKNKSEIDNIINNTKISYGKDHKEKLSEIVPVSYCQNIKKGLDYAGNKLKLNPVIKFTCSLDNALELLYEHDDIDELVIDLEKYVNIDYILVEKLLNFPNIKNKVVLLPAEIYSEFTNYFTDKEYNNVIVSRKMMEEHCSGSLCHPEVKRQSKLFNNYLNKKVSFKEIEITKTFEFSEIYVLLKGFFNIEESDEKVKMIANKVLRLLTILKSYIFFENTRGLENKEYVNHLLELIKIDSEVICSDIHYFSTEKLEKMMEMLSELTKNVISRNAYAKEIKSILKYSTKQNILFLVQNNKEKATVDLYIKNRYQSKNISCKTISKVDEVTFYDAIYIMGVIPRTNRLRNKLFSLLVSSEYHYIYHKSYLNYIKKLYNDYLEMFGEHTEVLYSNDSRMETDESSNYLEIDNDEYKLISDLSSFGKNLNLQDIVKFYFDIQLGSNQSSCDCLVDFNEYVGVFNKNYKVYRVNIEKKELDYIPVSNLLMGDEIIILNDEFRSGEFIEELMNSLLKINSFKEEHLKKVETSKMWKESLLKYISDSGATIKDISLKLKEIGLDKSNATFRYWIRNDYIVGPDNENDYKLISKLCSTYESGFDWEDVYEACCYVRRLHIKLRSDIGKLIVESYFNDDAVSENLSYLDIDFMDKVTICEVFSVSFDKFSVPSHIVNSIKRREY
ncbi:MAG: DrmE family protein [Acidaminobacteraceae bacterium]